MKIYTSYFGNYKKLQSANIQMLCVSLGKPKFVNCPQLKNLCPTGYMLSSSCSHETYLELYNKILQKQNAEDVIRQIESLSNGKDVALCCYEKPSEFCHRHLIAEWLTKNSNLIVEEFGESHEPKYIQSSLF